MSKHFNFFGILLMMVVLSCGQDEKSENTLIDEVMSEKEMKKDERPLNVRALEHVKKYLSIPENEKFEMEIYRKDLDGDEFEDAIITVNRLSYALDKAIESGKTAHLAEFGYMGNNNHFFYYDGGLDMISPPKLVPSSAKGKLRVNFIQITSGVKNDFTVDYNVGNSIYRNFYTIYNHTPFEMYQSPIADKIGTSDQKAYYIELMSGSYSEVKDIVSYEGRITNFSKSVNVYDFEPKIEKTGEKYLDAFYNPKDMKYYIRTEGLDIATE